MPPGHPLAARAVPSSVEGRQAAQGEQKKKTQGRRKKGQLQQEVSQPTAFSH